MSDGSRGGGKGDRQREQRARAVRAFVFMNRLFEYECRELGVSMAQYRMLLYLRHGPKRAGELAVQAAITRPSLSTLMGTLERQGLVHRGVVDDDRRGVRLELSREGLLAIARVEARFGTIFDEVANECDRPALVTALEQLAGVLQAQLEARVRADE
jgi:DNA-binding MarR family transcriptional regulator